MNHDQFYEWFDRQNDVFQTCLRVLLILPLVVMVLAELVWDNLRSRHG